MVALLQVTALGWREAAYAESSQKVRQLATQLPGLQLRVVG
jgi:hypothetical protein